MDEEILTPDAMITDMGTGQPVPVPLDTIFIIRQGNDQESTELWVMLDDKGRDDL